MLKISQNKKAAATPLQNITNSVHTRPNHNAKKSTRNHPFARNRRVNSMLDNYLAVTHPVSSDLGRRAQPNASHLERGAAEEANSSVSMELSVHDEQPIQRPPQLKYREHQINRAKKDMRTSPLHHRRKNHCTQRCQGLNEVSEHKGVFEQEQEEGR